MYQQRAALLKQVNQWKPIISLGGFACREISSLFSHPQNMKTKHAHECKFRFHIFQHFRGRWWRASNVKTGEGCHLEQGKCQIQEFHSFKFSHINLFEVKGSFWMHFNVTCKYFNVISSLKPEPYCRIRARFSHLFGELCDDWCGHCAPWITLQPPVTPQIICLNFYPSSA